MGATAKHYRALYVKLSRQRGITILGRAIVYRAFRLSLIFSCCSTILTRIYYILINIPARTGVRAEWQFDDLPHRARRIVVARRAPEGVLFDERDDTERKMPSRLLVRLLSLHAASAAPRASREIDAGREHPRRYSPQAISRPCTFSGYYRAVSAYRRDTPSPRPALLPGRRPGQPGMMAPHGSPSGLTRPPLAANIYHHCRDMNIAISRQFINTITKMGRITAHTLMHSASAVKMTYGAARHGHSALLSQLSISDWFAIKMIAQKVNKFYFIHAYTIPCLTQMMA